MKIGRRRRVPSAFVLIDCTVEKVDVSSSFITVFNVKYCIVVKYGCEVYNVDM